MNDNISIIGITPLDKYPPSKCEDYCKQCMKHERVCIPCQNLSMECINEINVAICINAYEVLKTIQGPKLFIYGTINIKVIYTANNCEQSVHSAHICIPFCEFILLKNFCYNICYDTIKYIFIGLENVHVNCYNEREIDLCIFFIICPQICNPCEDNGNNTCCTNNYPDKNQCCNYNSCKKGFYQKNQLYRSNNYDEKSIQDNKNSNTDYYKKDGILLNKKINKNYFNNIKYNSKFIKEINLKNK